MGYELQQGPEWLAALLYEAHGWLALVILMVAAAVIALSWIGYRSHGADERVRREMTRNLLVVGSMGAATIMLSSTGAFGYWIDVLGGSALGAIAAFSFRSWVGL